MGQILRLFFKAWPLLIKNCLSLLIMNLWNHTPEDCGSHWMLSIVCSNCSPSFKDFYRRNARSRYSIGITNRNRTLIMLYSNHLNVLIAPSLCNSNMVKTIEGWWILVIYLQSSLLLVGLGVGSEQWSRQDTATMQIKYVQNNHKMVNSCRPFTVQPIE